MGRTRSVWVGHLLWIITHDCWGRKRCHVNFDGRQRTVLTFGQDRMIGKIPRSEVEVDFFQSSVDIWQIPKIMNHLFTSSSSSSLVCCDGRMMIIFIIFIFLFEYWYFNYLLIYWCRGLPLHWSLMAHLNAWRKLTSHSLQTWNLNLFKVLTPPSCQRLA